MSDTFWSRRRAAVEAEERAEQQELDATALAEEHAVLEEKTDDEILTELDLPDPETLQMGDDFSAFMTKAVPDRIRRRALRVLWKSNPVLANVDNLVDYGEDFTDSATVVENMQTAYQVGKGMLKHVEEMARKAAAAAEAENAPDPEETEPEEDLVLAQAEEAAAQEDTPDIESPEEYQTTESYVAPEPEEDEIAVVPTPRRMKFRLEETA